MAARQPVLARSFLGDQLVGHVQGLLRATGRTDVKAVLAVDDHRWHAADLVGHAQALGVGHLALHAEGVVGLQEGVFIHTLSGEELGHFIGAGELLAVFLDGFEHRSVDLGFDTHGLQGDKHLPVQVPHATEHGGHANKIHVIRQLGDPRIDGRLEVVAMRAAVPEQLHHFDLARLGHGNRAAQLHVLFARLDILGLGHAKQAGAGKNGRKDQVTHA